MGKLILGDCIDILPTIDKNSVDLILIDPPYIISKDSGFKNMSESTNDECRKKYGGISIDFGEWDKEELDLDFLLKEFYRILKPHGTLIMFYDIWKMETLKNTAEKHKFKQPRLCCWQKTNPVPINSKVNYLSNAKEYFITFVKRSKPTFNSKYDTGDYFVEEETETYYLPILGGKERTKHPTQKPLALIKQLIEKHSNENMVVLDCFAGSGTTGVAAKELGRDYIMIEREEEYFKIIEERVESLCVTS